MGSVRSSEVVGGLDVPASSLPRVSAPSSLLAEERVGGILVSRAILREGSTAGFLSVVRLLVAVADRGVGSGPVVAGRVGGSRVLGVVSRSVDEDAVAELGAAEGPVLAGEFDLEGLAGGDLERIVVGLRNALPARSTASVGRLGCSLAFQFDGARLDSLGEGLLGGQRIADGLDRPVVELDHEVGILLGRSDLLHGLTLQFESHDEGVVAGSLDPYVYRPVGQLVADLGREVVEP